jgi:hypothetical protein
MTSRLLALLLCLGVMQGCAVSQEGVGIRIPSSDEKVQARLEQLKQNAAEQGSSNPGLIVVGKTSAFRPINEKNAARVLKMYLRDAKSMDRSKPPAMTEAELLENYAGWTKLKFANAVIAGMYGTALVPKSIREQVDFSSSVLTVLWQDSEDLVAAVTNVDGVPVVTKLLCPAVSGYYTCARTYVKGVFDANTGKETDLKTFAAKDKGKTIDPHTFERMHK